MSRQFKLLMLLVNVLLGLLYVFSSYYFWEELNNWYDWNLRSTWTPCFVYPHRIPGTPTVEMPVQPMLNLPFMIFWIIIITNCAVLATYLYIIPRIQSYAAKNVK